jgi:hypothetical protein
MWPLAVTTVTGTLVLWEPVGVGGTFPLHSSQTLLTVAKRSWLEVSRRPCGGPGMLKLQDNNSYVVLLPKG